MHRKKPQPSEPTGPGPEAAYSEPEHPTEAEQLAEESEELENDQPDDCLDTPLEAQMAANLQAALHDLQLERASFATFRQRIDKEKAEIRRYSGQELATDLLRVLDYFEMSLKFEGEELPPAAQNVIEGVKYTLQELHNVLAKHGIEPVEAAGKFDPATMEAIGREERAEVEPGTVLSVQTRGYRFKDRMLRPARVIVAGAPEASGEEAGTPVEVRFVEEG